MDLRPVAHQEYMALVVEQKLNFFLVNGTTGHSGKAYIILPEVE